MLALNKISVQIDNTISNNKYKNCVFPHMKLFYFVIHLPNKCSMYSLMKINRS